jgi:hypothetical protein
MKLHSGFDKALVIQSFHAKVRNLQPPSAKKPASLKKLTGF